MSNPIGARKDGSFKAVSTAPSINKTPVGSSTPPLPYPTIADLSNSVGVVPNVEFNGQPVYVLGQTTQPSCTGDSAGSAGGVKSGAVNGEVKPIKGSATVYAGGKAMIRHGDPCTMHKGNNPGIYITSASGAEGPAAVRKQNANPPVFPENPEEQAWFSANATVGYIAGGAVVAGKGIPPFIPGKSAPSPAPAPGPAGDGLTVLGKTVTINVPPSEVQFRRVYDDGTAISGLPFTAQLSTGGVVKGKTDGDGLGKLQGLPLGTTALITYDLDPNPPQASTGMEIDHELWRLLND